MVIALRQLSPGLLPIPDCCPIGIIRLLTMTSEAETTFVNEIYRALPINCNFTEEQDKLMNHAYIPRCLSLQAALGFKSRYKPRSLTSAISWAILNLRHASMLFAFFFQYNRGAAPEPHDPGRYPMVRSFLIGAANGICKMYYGWSLETLNGHWTFYTIS